LFPEFTKTNKTLHTMKVQNITISIKNQKSITERRIHVFALSLLFFLSGYSLIYAQDDCSIEKFHGQGFSTAISSVIENGNGSHTITLSVINDGCPSPGCKSMSHYSVEALPGTYSDVSVEVISGNMTYGSIYMGPNLGSDPFDGFKIDSIKWIGGGIAGEFQITYTLTGGFQNQQINVKIGSSSLLVAFSMEEFQAVLYCSTANIFPYYAPPEGGKLENSLIGPELNSLYYTYLNTGTAVSDNIFQIDVANVLIRVFALPGQMGNLLNILASPSYGLTDEVEITELNAVTGWFPISNLLMINALGTYVNYARPEYPPQSNAGLVTTQGDIAMRSYIARNAFNLGGEGVKIGVMSDSYNKKFGNPANDDILKGDLPGVAIGPDGDMIPNPVNSTNVHVLKDYPYTASDEGRAMLQIIHDIVPKADLAFRTGFISAKDFADGINELKDAGCDIIVDDITYITEPFFQDGIVAQAVNDVVAEGVVYFSAAGNFGSNAYENTFFPGTAPSGLSGTAHNFAGNAGYDIYQSISLLEGNYLIVLQWDDGSDFGSTATDLDIYLTNNSGNALFGFNRVNTGGDPIEVLPFTVGAGGAQANLVILKAGGAEDVRFKFIVFRGQLTMDEYANVGNSTIVGQANAEGAIAVGAVLYSNTPEYGVNPPTIASFSSRGGTVVNGVDRMKPEITAPNGVNTTVDLGGFNFEGDPFPNFFGTSAAAPHAAAVAALLLEAGNKFYDSALSPADVRSILTSTAIDMGAPGYDPASGFGFIQADAALLTMANPSPVISELAYDNTLFPGIDSITVTIIGQFLTEGSQIYFNGEPLETETTINGDSVAVSIIPPFTELYPMIQVYNPPNALTNGTDGGLSNPLYFNTKETLLITIDDKNKKYGESLPPFTATYSVESIDGSFSLEDAGLTADEMARVLSIPFEALNVSPLSNSGLWAITASTNDPLNPESGIPATDPIDLALLDRFDFTFISGLLLIERLDLLIKPQDAVFTYGEPVDGIEFDYVYNDDPDNPLSIPPEVNTQLLSLFQAGHATALVNGISTTFLGSQATALVNKSLMVSATALVNSIGLIEIEFNDPDIIFDSAALVNGLATALVNGKATALVNAAALVAGQATALVNGQATALVNAASLGYATALVNTTTFNATSNNESIILLTDEDIYILAGLAPGEITLISMNLIESSSAGTYWIVPGTFVTNNFNVTYEPGQITFLPAQATINFVSESLAQTYHGSPVLPLVITDPEGLQFELTFDGFMDAPVNAGYYEVVATIMDPNYTGADTAYLTINPVQVSIAADNLQKNYGETDPELTYQITEGGLIGDDALSGELIREAGEDVASYNIMLGSLGGELNYSISFTPGILKINKAKLFISVETTFIYAGDPLPDFNYGFETFAFDDDASVLIGLNCSVSPAYNGSAGTYTLIPTATAWNYDIVPVNGTLYVNPFGPGTKHIIPKLICVEKVINMTGFTHIAYFGYTNNNTHIVYIPKGPENVITSFGLFDDSEQPEVFLPGNHSFAVPFDGTLLAWTVASYNHKGQKTSAGASASSTSKSCSKSSEADDQYLIADTLQEVRIFPNPASEKIYIRTGEDYMTNMDVQLYDIFGNHVSVKMIRYSGDLLEVDLSGFNAGMYIVRVNYAGKVESYRVVKQ
jgi:subtilisin family serine protease